MKSKPFQACLTVALVLTVLSGCAAINKFQVEGELPLENLDAPVTVRRDAQGVAYIQARSLADGLTAQGFVTAQDRLFQMELTRRMAAGRISEFVGDRAKRLDIRMRAIGCLRHARAHAKILSAETRGYFQRYVDGINAYIATRADTYPLEFKLAGIRPEPWSVADSLSIAYLLGWQTSANLKHEIVAQYLVEKIGEKQARTIFPLNINPDDPRDRGGQQFSQSHGVAHLGLGAQTSPAGAMAYIEEDMLRLGSNNWAVAPRRTKNGRPIVANDPHLDARLLPGPLYPSGIFTKGLKIVGAGIPGLPGMVIFRNNHVATSASNSYGDSQDLYVETVDPDNPSHYLEGDQPFSFQVTEETIKIKDKKAPGGLREETVDIRRTRRGPVVSNLLPGLDTEKIVTLRWAPAETMGPMIGLEHLLQAKSVAEVRDALSHVTMVMLNFIFADTGGNIGWQSTGKLPVRNSGDGTIPLPVTTAKDNWSGWIPFQQMPADENPQKGWLGVCNHKTVTTEFPYHYSSYFAPSNRYRRLKQLIEPASLTTADDHWEWQVDTFNLTARAVAPLMAAALSTRPQTARMAEILAQWNFQDDPDLSAPTIFHSVYLAFAHRVFIDELGENTTVRMLADPYFWEERLEQIALSADSPWLDDVNTEIVESRDDIFLLAAGDAQKVLSAQLGPDPEEWKWGRVHRIEFLNPIRRKGFGKGWLGGGNRPAPGSGATLNRGRYDFNDPYQVTVSPAMRVVFDLSDPDKITAVLAGGVSGRTFSPHMKDQIDAFLSGEKRYWWFSQKAVAENAVSELVLKPGR